MSMQVVNSLLNMYCTRFSSITNYTATGNQLQVYSSETLACIFC